MSTIEIPVIPIDHDTRTDYTATKPLFYTIPAVQSFLNRLHTQTKNGFISQIEAKEILKDYGFIIEYYTSVHYRVIYWNLHFSG